MTAREILRAMADLIAAGVPVDQAFDRVMGAGAYARLAGEVWETLRAA